MRYAREDHPMTEGRVQYDPEQDIMAGEDQNGNVSRLLNDVQKQLAILHEELGGLAHRLKAISAPVPTETEDGNGMTDGPKAMMSPLAESVQVVLMQVRHATARVREIKAGVDL